ncbi:class I SAM-dependent methyltransferase [Dactylosporangium sp. NPDC051485]|uniref:class I SAM-dependent methyltransferase n=1 Tax=Dactylosporangium sp. NPDC051485 TaxID=3154846 RepID=UPI00342B233C
MAMIEYDQQAAAAFVAGRHLDDDALAAWRERVAHHLRPTPATRLLDLGSGTGHWAASFRRWYGIDVLAVEPSAAMRAAAAHPTLEGDAANIPLDDAAVDAVWLSTVVHHIPDLPAAVTEIRRVLRPGGLVLIRSAFAGRTEGVSLFRHFREAARILDARFPSVEAVVSAFAGAGCTEIALEPVAQRTAETLAEVLATFDRAAHTPLLLLNDEEYATGLSRLRAADPTEPVIDHLDMLVLKAPGEC